MDADRTARVAAEYVLPLRWSHDDDLGELTAYLAALSAHVDVTVVDGSPAPLFAAHADRWGVLVRHLPPERWFGGNGKVAGVMTGVRAARHEAVVVADDDVRWTADQLAEAVALLRRCDVLRVQNVFRPRPWHAHWDSARTLVNRGLGADFPGTLVLRRAALLRAGGYDGDVLFENLELLRTVRAHGGTELRADGLYVLRRPPTAAHFRSQRVRQAYDSLAQPARLVAEAAVLPVVARAVVVRRPGAVLLLAAAALAAAACGRARDGGRAHFSVSDVAWAPVWVLERGICCWVAIALRLRGGVRYHGRRLTVAAHPVAALRRRATL